MELFVSKAGAKVQTFFELAKKIFQKIFIALKVSIMSLKKKRSGNRKCRLPHSVFCIFEPVPLLNVDGVAKRAEVEGDASIDGVGGVDTVDADSLDG